MPLSAIPASQTGPSHRPGLGSRYTRTPVLSRARLARARLDQDAVDGAVEAAHATLDDLSNGLASWRVSSELDAVARRLSDYPKVSGVDNFMDRYQATNR